MFSEKSSNFTDPFLSVSEGFKLIFVMNVFLDFFCLLFIKKGKKIINSFRTIDQIKIKSNAIKMVLWGHEHKPIYKCLNPSIFYFDVLVEKLSFLFMLDDEFCTF